jgi:hypothetical protein
MTASTPPALSRANAAGERALDGADLVVDGDADALEGPGRGMDPHRVPVAGGNGLGDQRRKGGRAGQGAGAAGRGDRADNAAPVGLLAEIADGAREHLGSRRLEPARGRHAVARVHAHVGRRILPEGEAAGRVVELEGRDAEVEEDAVEP